MNVGEVLTFGYTGGIQNVTLTDKGLYKLEVWGAQGGDTSVNQCHGGNGGFAQGYILVNNNTKLYICVGGQGEARTYTSTTARGGYNGGGDGIGADNEDTQTGGGGATHIALVSGTLESIGKTSFVTNHNGLIVAGGGGGGGGYTNTPLNGGGYGGGTTGGPSGDANVGTQTGGYAFGKGIGTGWGGGGGGGFYGGGKRSDGDRRGACGGSGWIGGVPAITFKGTTYSPAMSNGSRSGNGYARITYIAKGSSIGGTLDGVPFESATFNGSEVETITFNGTSVA